MAGFSAHLWDWWTLLHPYLPSLLVEARERVFRFRQPPDRFVHNAQWLKLLPLSSSSLLVADSSSVVVAAVVTGVVAAVDGGDALFAAAAVAAYLAIAVEKVFLELNVPPVYVGCSVVLANANPNKVADGRTIILLNLPENFQRCLTDWYSILKIQEA